MNEHATRSLRTTLRTPSNKASGRPDSDLPITAAVLESFLCREDMRHIQRLATIGQLTASFSHEVNNALSLIEGSLTLAREVLPDDHPVLANLAAIERAGKQMEDMSSRMLTFGRARPSYQRLCNIREIIDDAVELMRPHCRCNRVTVLVDVPEALLGVSGERWQILEAVVNLLRNACDAVSNSSRREVSISASSEGEQIRIAISDTGSGIPGDILSKIFQPFFTTKGERGTGLGLYLTRKFVEEHHGTIEVRSDSGGTIFTVSLPLQQGTGASYSP